MDLVYKHQRIQYSYLLVRKKNVHSQFFYPAFFMCCFIVSRLSFSLLFHCVLAVYLLLCCGVMFDSLFVSLMFYCVLVVSLGLRIQTRIQILLQIGFGTQIQILIQMRFQMIRIHIRTQILVQIGFGIQMQILIQLLKRVVLLCLCCLFLFCFIVSWLFVSLLFYCVLAV